MKSSMKNGALAVSLRGSLASEFMQLSSKTDATPHAMNVYLAALINSCSPDLLKSFDAGELIIGKKSEVGLFPPNW